MTPEPMYNLEAERYILGSILKDNFCMDQVTGFTPEDFYQPIHQDVFAEMLNLSTKGSPIDPATVGDNLRRAGKITNEEEENKAGELLSEQYTTVHLSHYTQIVKRHSVRRRLLQTILSLQREIESPMDAEGLLDVAEQSVLAVREKGLRSETMPLQHYLHKTMQEIDDAENGCDVGLDTGLPELDKYVTMRKGQLIVIAARPGGGKSICGLQFGIHNAKYGKPVAFYSLEMSGEELAARAISSYANIDASYTTRKRKAINNEAEKLGDAVADLSRLPLYINEKAWNTVGSILADARRMKRKHKIELVIVDYLQLVQSIRGRNQQRYEQLGEITQSLKQLAKELQLPVILLAQLNRESEKNGGDKEPQLWHIKESGAAEQDADIALLLWSTKEPGKENTVFIKVAKNRQGMRDVIIEAEHAKSFMKFCSPGAY